MRKIPRLLPKWLFSKRTKSYLVDNQMNKNKLINYDPILVNRNGVDALYLIGKSYNDEIEFHCFPNILI